LIEKEYAKERSRDKPLLNLVVIGHVDAGKSTLMGHVLFLLGAVSKKTMHRHEQDSKKLGKASFAFAWVLDETAEERSRGITMDVANARVQTEHRTLNLLDAPGHKDFIPNMITGAAQADVAILVVDATRGEFETGFSTGGQTREHTMLIRSLGVSQLAVAVNKLDTCEWSQERFNEIVDQLKPFLKQTGFSDSSVTFVPCSGLSGENLHKKSAVDKLVAWYDGPCLIDVIDNMKPPERAITRPLRMCITDVFKGMSSGIHVGGRLESGTVASGDKVIIMPASEVAVVKTLSISDSPIPRAYAGDTIVAVLDKCDAQNISTGSVVCCASEPIRVVTKFAARIVIFNVDVPVTKGFPVILHFQSLQEQAHISKLLREISKTTGHLAREKPRCLTRNSSGEVVIKVAQPICLELYKDCKELGRITLRSAGQTIAAGVVTAIL